MKDGCQSVAELKGIGLTLFDVEAVARQGKPVSLSREAVEKLNKASSLIMAYLSRDEAVYGLNRGVGLNKDRVVQPLAMADFNVNLIRSHAAGCGPDAPEDVVRAAMLVRLHCALSGAAGLSAETAERYAAFLNKGIHPVIPELGSVGEADIVLLSHIGLAMIGEGEVMHQGVRMEAARALELSGLQPLRLGPKEGLGIVSSNAFSAGRGCLVLIDCLDLLDMCDLAYALSLEGLQGNTSPLDPSVRAARPLPGYAETAKHIASLLDGSSLWERSSGKPLQDPISFRAVPHVHGACRTALASAWRELEFHINHPDDNPLVLAEEGRIVPSAHFEPLHWVLAMESLGIAIAHVAQTSVQRTLRLGNPALTGLTRFLTPDEQAVIGMGTLQKTAASLEAEIRLLAHPSSLDSSVLAGEMEDRTTNAPLAVSKLERMLDLLRYITATELLHAVQAIHLRQGRGGIRLGASTSAAYQYIRTRLEPLERDRPFTDDVRIMYGLIRDLSLTGAAGYSTRGDMKRED